MRISSVAVVICIGNLSRPVTGRLEFAYRPDLTYSAPPCDLENARRFINE